jgi:hypothetical protein
VAGELADEYNGTLVPRNLLIPAFAAELSGACNGKPASEKPVPGIVERADVARRKAQNTGIPFTEALLPEPSQEPAVAEPDDGTEAGGSVAERAEAACKEDFIASEYLNDAGTLDPGLDSGGAGEAEQALNTLAAEIDEIAASGSGAEQQRLEAYADGVRELGELTGEIASAGAGAKTALKKRLRSRANEVQRPLEPGFCQDLLEIYR